MAVKKIVEGKTKIIWTTENPEVVLIENKDDITAGDGARKDSLVSKGKIATTTTVNAFRLLKKTKIPNHFINQVSPTSFTVHKATMIPLECVARRIAFGSFIKRNPHIPEGKRMKIIPVEFYIKDDKRHDPILEIKKDSDKALLFSPKDPVSTRTSVGKVELKKLGITHRDILKMKSITRKVFRTFENTWAEQDVTLVDMKIEFGKNEKGKIMVADVIDNDSWRIWPKGDKSKMLDKQSYRDGKDLETILKNYKKVEKMTNNFI